MNQQNKSRTASELRGFTIHFYESRTALGLWGITIHSNEIH